VTALFLQRPKGVVAETLFERRDQIHGVRFTSDLKNVVLIPQSREKNL
jgi:hypothetical protein